MTRILVLAAGAASIFVALAAPRPCRAATWQYCVPFEAGRKDKGGQAQEGKVLLWLPPESKTIRGVLVGGQLGIELEMFLDAQVRKACADNDLAIVYFVPHLSACSITGSRATAMPSAGSGPSMIWQSEARMVKILSRTATVQQH
jgi:hypothetical protein